MTSTSFYVCNDATCNGADTNDGSEASPWQTISKVMQEESCFAPGTTIYFNGGDVWQEQLTLNNVHGVPQLPITFTSYGSGRPIIDGNNGTINSCITADQSSGSGSNVSYITVDGFECRNTYEYGINFIVSNTAMPGIVIQNNYIHNTGAGAYAGGTGPYDDNKYANQLNAMDSTSGASGGDGFQILGNTVNNCGGHNCLQVHDDVGGPVVDGNRVGPGCVHNCIDTKGVVNGRVSNNIVTCPNCSSTTAAFYTENVYISHETINYIGNIAYSIPVAFQAETGGRCSRRAKPCSIDANYYNNTIYDPTGFNFIDSSCTNHTLDIEKNIIDGPGKTDIHSSCALTWNFNDDGATVATSGYTAGANDIIGVNPCYVAPANGNFTPQSQQVSTYGAGDPATSFSYLGALSGTGAYTCP